MDAELIQTLSSGADAATLYIVFMLWKIERRVFKLEMERVLLNGKTQATS